MKKQWGEKIQCALYAHQEYLQKFCKTYHYAFPDGSCSGISINKSVEPQSHHPNEVLGKPLSVDMTETPHSTTYRLTKDG